MRRVPAILALLCACTHQELHPAPQATAVHGSRTAAESTASGVRVVIDGNAWNGYPANLTSVVPVKIAIQNNSGKNILIRYGDLTLMSPAGNTQAALPPLAVAHEALAEGAPAFTAGPVPVPFVTGIYGDGFYVAAPYGPYYRGFPPWPGTFPFAYGYYDNYYPYWPQSLPTTDMLAKALPEGVLDNGGNVSGFLFFQKVPKGVKEVQLRAHLVDAQTGTQFGTVMIPLKPVTEG